MIDLILLKITKIFSYEDNVYNKLYKKTYYVIYDKKQNYIVSALIDFILFIYYARILENEKNVDDSLNMYHVQYWFILI